MTKLINDIAALPKWFTLALIVINAAFIESKI